MLRRGIVASSVLLVLLLLVGAAAITLSFAARIRAGRVEAEFD